MLSFWDWAGGPVVGSHYNDAILQSAGIRSKYDAVEGNAEKHIPVSDCKFFGKNCNKKTRHKKDRKKLRRKNG